MNINHNFLEWCSDLEELCSLELFGSQACPLYGHLFGDFLILVGPRVICQPSK